MSELESSSSLLAYSLPDSEKVSSEEFDETAGPSIRKTIVIKRKHPDIKITTFSRLRDNEKVFQDPISLDNKNYELIQRKYSKKNRKTKDYLEDILIKAFGKLPFSELYDVLSYEKLDELSSRLFVISAYTIENYFGKPGPKSADANDLYLYIHKLFNIDKKEENSDFGLLRFIEPPEFFLKLFVLEASSLKQINHLNKLYCNVWISSEPKLIEMTHLVQEFSHPVWYVRFLFTINNLKTDIISIEMRNAAEDIVKENGANNTIHLKNALWKRLLQKVSGVSKKDEDRDLIGKVEIRLSDIYSEGIDEWIPLNCAKAEYKDIFLHIRAKFEVTPPDTYSYGLERHLLLLRVCIEDGIKCTAREFENREEEKIVSWEKLLNTSGLTLIFLHSVISCLKETEDLLCRFIVITHFGVKTESISHEFLYHLLHEIVEHLKTPCDDFVENHLKLMYEKEVRNLYNYCFKFISSLHSQKRTFLEFEFALRSTYLCQNIIELDAAPLMVLRSEAVNWLEKKIEKIMTVIPEKGALYIADFLDYLFHFQKGMDEALQRVVPCETYTELTYKNLQDILFEPLKFQISEFSSHFLKSSENEKHNGAKVREEGIEIFSKIKQFVCYISKIVDIPALELKLGKFGEWFGQSAVIDWYQYRQEKAEKEIENSVLFDGLRTLDISFTLDKSYKESFSARQVHEIINKSLKELWILVSFPRSSMSDEMLLRGLHSCCLKYSHLLKKLIDSKKLLEEFYSGGRTFLCVIANNLWFTAVFAEKIVQDTVGIIPSNIPNSQTTLENSCKEVCSCLLEKYLVDIERLLRNSLLDKRNLDEINLGEYFYYIENIVWNEMYIDVSLDVFVIFLRNLIKSIITMLHEYSELQFRCSDSNIEAKKFLSILIRILIRTKEICNISNCPEKNALVWDVSYSDFLSDLENRIT